MKTQKELKALYLQELQTNSTWRNDQKMQEYISKKIDYVVEFHNGCLLALKKPHMERRFCFGYSDDYSNRDYERASDMAEYARTNEQYFIDKNLEDTERIIQEYKEALESERMVSTRTEKPMIITKARTGDLKDCKICETEWAHIWDIDSEKKRLARFDSELVEMTREDIQEMLDGLEQVKANFTKRLQTYLKRYGLTKIHTWTYWRDE